MTDKKILTELTDVDTYQRLPLRYVYNGDGTYSVATSSGQVKNVSVDTASTAELLAKWDLSEVDPSDVVLYKQCSNGQSILALSANPITDNSNSAIKLNATARTSCELEVEYSVNRFRHQFASIALYANKDAGADPVPDPINISSIYQCSAINGAAYNSTAGTVITIVLDSPLPGVGSPACVYLSDWIHVDGIIDSRLNVKNATISYISPDRKTLTVGYSDDAALASIAIATVSPTLGTAKVYFYNNMSGASDGAIWRFSGATSTNASLATLFNSGDVQISGTLTGSHAVTCANTLPTFSSAADGNVDIKAPSRYQISCQQNATVFSDKASDTQANWAIRATRTGVKPSNVKHLQPRFRIYAPIGMARPIAKIVSATKTGTTTATVVTASAHGLVTGNYVILSGSRDTTNWANSSTATMVTVVNSTTLTVTWGTAVSATQYGGSVHLAANNIAAGNVISQNISVAQVDYNGWLILTGTATWAGLSVGDYVNVYGCRDSNNGNDLSVDGMWEVANLSTTTLKLMPVYDINGTRISPSTSLSTTNASGNVIVRTTARIHDVRFRDISLDTQVLIDGQGSGRTDKALPVTGVGGTITAIQGSPTTISSTGTGGWFIQPGVRDIIDITSTALTTTSTSSSIANNLGTAFQVSFPVTAVSGTNPTLDIRIEESFDNGINWVTLYEMQRITATGSYNTPVLSATGRNVRYVRTVTGTTPSFTMSVIRSILPFANTTDLRRLMDRTIVLTTLGSTTPALFTNSGGNVQLTVNIGAATTAPVLQLQASEDGTNYFDIGTTLTAVASGTVSQTIVGQNYLFVRAIVKTAGSAVTAGYVSIKTWNQS